MGFGRGSGGDIIIKDLSTGERYDYDNYKGEATVFYDLVRDSRTKKFPVLELTFWNEFGHFNGHVINDTWNIHETFSIFFDERNCTWERTCFFDLNDFIDPTLENENFVTVKIYTGALTFLIL